MTLLNKVKDYVLEREFNINLKNNQINIVNYKSIEHFDNNLVIVLYELGYIDIYGSKLVVTKLLNDEVLVKGNIKKVELRTNEE